MVQTSVFSFPKFMFHIDIHQRDGRFLHLGYQMLYLGKNIIVEQLKYQSYDTTKDGGYQRHLHTGGDNGRTDIACLLYLVESHHHTYHGTEESERRCHSDKQGNP